MGWIKKLSKALSEIDPTNKNSAIREEAARFDKNVLQPLWEDAAWALFPAFSVAAQAYIERLDDQAEGKYKPLPVWLRMVLDDLNAYDIDINKVHYAEGIDTGHGMAITIGYNIYFPWALNLDQNAYSVDDLQTMLHELEHVVQYKRTGGVAPFLAKYVAQSILATLQHGSSVINIHNNISLEEDATNKANDMIQLVVQGAIDLPTSWPIAVQPIPQARRPLRPGRNPGHEDRLPRHTP